MQTIDELSVKLFFLTIFGNLFSELTQSSIGTIFTILAAISTIVYNIIKTRKELNKKE